MKQERLVKVEDIPDTLRCTSTKHLRLPEKLITAWISLLDKNGIREQAKKDSPKSIAGGLTEQATKEHLAWRFTGSAARVELAILNPNHHKSEISDAFAKIFSGGKVLLADAPCGSGAAALSVLTTIAELRAQSVLPRMPLEVVLIGGEISEHARTNFLEAIQNIKDDLEKQAITVSAFAMHWDVCEKLANSDLSKQLTLLGQECNARMLLLANFSEFLQGNGKWKDAQPQFDELFRHFRSERSSVIWIEPQTNKALPDKGGLFRRVISWIAELKFVSLFSRGESKDNVLKDSCKVFNPLDNTKTFRTQLAVIRVDLDI